MGETPHKDVSVDVRAICQVKPLKNHANVPPQLPQPPATQPDKAVRADRNRATGHGHKAVDSAD
jgi:hypothetical protein